MIDRQAIEAAAGTEIGFRNCRCGPGERDAVARYGETLPIVEARTRSSETYGRAAPSASRTKRQRLAPAARQRPATPRA